MKSLTAVRKKSSDYPVEFKITMVNPSHRPEISVAQLAREHRINDNLPFKWCQYWREGKLCPPLTAENSMPELLPITLDAEDVSPDCSRSQSVAAATPESLNISCEVAFRHRTLRLNDTVSENLLAGADAHRLPGYRHGTVKTRLQAPLEEALQNYVLTDVELHVDDMPAPVLLPGNKKTKIGRLWTYVCEDRNAGTTLPPAVRFTYSPDRKTSICRAILPASAVYCRRMRMPGSTDCIP